MTLGMLIKVALDQALQQAAPPEVIDVTPKPEPPPPALDPGLEAARQRGREAGENFGGIWGPFGWSEAPKEITGPRPTDSRAAAEQDAFREGYDEGKQRWHQLNNQTRVDVASKTMAGADKVIDATAGQANKLYNKLTGSNADWGAARNWDEARGLTDYKQEDADYNAEHFYDVNTPEGQEQAYRNDALRGKTPWTAHLMEYGWQHPGSWQERAGNALGFAEDIGNQLLMRDSGINLGLSAIPVPGVRSGLRVPAVMASNAALGSEGILNGIGAATGDTRAALAIGADDRQIKEKRMREVLGNKFTNDFGDSRFMGTWQDDQGNLHYFSGKDIDPSMREQSMQFFPDYRQYMDYSSLPYEQMNEQKNLMGYVMNRISAGTPGARELFYTPMFQMLNPENKVTAYETWAERSYLNRESFDQMIFHGLDSKAAMLSAALMHDKTGVLNDGTQAFFSSADVPTLVSFLDRHAEGGSGGIGSGGDTSALMNVIRNGIQQNMKEHPENVWPLLDNSLKLSAAQAIRDGKNPNASSEGARMIQTMFKNVLADPELVRNMPAQDKVDLISALAKTYSGQNGQALLGAEGDELSSAAMDNLQSEAAILLQEHPEYAPELAKAYLHFKKMPGAAEVAGNPWVFWLGAGTLLFGGLALARSVFDDDEDEDEELSDYEKALRRRAYS